MILKNYAVRLFERNQCIDRGMIACFGTAIFEYAKVIVYRLSQICYDTRRITTTKIIEMG